ncbi:hypothetical protein RZS08_10390, partial [Arthrospira platensis SPKY1]|nr:hypothetical protein [Arthrospira platensis SPKY1]
TLADLVAFEQPPLFIGTTTLGEFLPRWVETLPDTQALRDELVATGNPDRLSPSANVAVQQRAGPPWNAVYRLQVDEPATLTYRQFYFPGWQATLNGRSLAIEPSRTHGLIQFDLPSGAHTLNLAFKSSWPRRLGWGLTLLGLLLCPALPLILRRAGAPPSPPSLLAPSPSRPLAPSP